MPKVNDLPPKNCLQCKKEFGPKKYWNKTHGRYITMSRINWEKMKYCSNDCVSESKRGVSKPFPGKKKKPEEKAKPKKKYVNKRWLNINHKEVNEKCDEFIKANSKQAYEQGLVTRMMTEAERIKYGVI